MNEQHCNQCENQCPVNALRCNRGRAHFAQETVEPKIPAGTVGLLQKCGFVLHHGGIEPEGALSALSGQEQAELERLLSVLLADWQKQMPEGMKNGHHHGHYNTENLPLAAFLHTMVSKIASSGCGLAISSVTLNDQIPVHSSSFNGKVTLPRSLEVNIRLPVSEE